jgi:hypothetical protein
MSEKLFSILVNKIFAVAGTDAAGSETSEAKQGEEGGEGRGISSGSGEEIDSFILSKEMRKQEE